VYINAFECCSNGASSAKYFNEIVARVVWSMLMCSWLARACFGIETCFIFLLEIGESIFPSFAFECFPYTCNWSLSLNDLLVAPLDKMFVIKSRNNIISTCFKVFQGSCYPFTKSSRTKVIVF